MAQSPTRVDGVSRSTRAKRLANDLSAVTDVESAEVSQYDDELVKLQVSRQNLTADVMRVLADHGANISGICLEADASFQEATVHPPRE
jgi:hypothetical protein